MHLCHTCLVACLRGSRMSESANKATSATCRSDPTARSWFVAARSTVMAPSGLRSAGTLHNGAQDELKFRPVTFIGHETKAAPGLF